jgi:adenylosuccinate lyase
MHSAGAFVSARQLSMYSAPEIEAILAFVREARWIAERDTDANVCMMLRRLASIFEHIAKRQSA